MGGALSDAIGRKPVLLTISTLSLLTTYPALHWLVADPTFGKMLAVELWFSFFFGVYNGAMVVSLVRGRAGPCSGELVLAGLQPRHRPVRHRHPVGLDLPDRADRRPGGAGYWLMAAAACGIIAAMVIYRSGAIEAREAAVAAQQA